MEGGTRSKGDSKNVQFIKSYEENESVESHDRLHAEGTRYIEVLFCLQQNSPKKLSYGQLTTIPNDICYTVIDTQ